MGFGVRLLPIAVAWSWVNHHLGYGASQLSSLLADLSANPN
jgi:hypothetical protein